MTELRTQLQGVLGSAYTIDRELGGGGMSRVFLAEEVALGRKVVVKVLPPDVTAGVNVERFKREIQLSAKLQHPHIVPVLSTGEMNGVPYYTMPFVEGQSLRARLGQGVALQITETLSILRDVARALAYAHERGIAHRDIKPDNILLSGGSATVADFGIAKAISAARGDAPAETLTSIGTSLGTPAYMAPEQAAADPSTNHRADIYAFGCVAYELLAGRPPFVEKTPQRLLAAQMADRPQPIAELRPDTPPALAALVMQCLEKEADARPQAASEIVRVLETVTSGTGQSAMPPILLGGPATFRRALMLYVAAFAGVAIVAKAAIIATGIPDWVFPGALIVMALGLPVLLFTAYTQRVTRRALTMTPTYTPGGTPALHGTMATMAMKASPHLSWQRAMRWGGYALGAFALIVAAFMTLRTLGIGPAGSLFAAGKLNERDRVIVTDFQSSDSSLATLVNEAVRTNLGQSRVVSIMPPVAIGSALQRMQRPATSRLDFALAREVAQREGVKAVVDGAIRPLGAGFGLSIRLVSVDSAIELAAFQDIANTPADLLQTVDRLTRKLRGKMGESLKDVRGSAPLEQVTTPSLEALRIYAEAARDLDMGGVPAASAQRLREAVKIDTAFAMAWRKLGVALNNASAPRPAIDSALERAYRFRDRLTEKERLVTEGSYFQIGPGRDRRKAVAAYERLLALDPADNAGLNNLANILMSKRDYARAESLYRAMIASGRGTSQAYGNVLNALVFQGRLDDALREAAAVRRQFPAVAQGYQAALVVYYQRGQLDSLEKFITDGLRLPYPSVHAGALDAMSTYAQLRGRYMDGWKYFRQVQEARRAMGLQLRAPVQDTLDMTWQTLTIFQDTAAAIRLADGIAVGPGFRTLTAAQRPYVDLALIYAIAGQPQKAHAMVRRFNAEVSDTVLKRSQGTGIIAVDAVLALNEGKYADGIRLIWKSDTTYDGPDGACASCVYRALGEAWDRAGNADSAIHYREKYLATPTTNMFGGSAEDPLMKKRLGELYEAKGNVTKAAEYYREFVKLWENADPKLQPRVLEVRRRLSRMANTEGTR